MPNLKYSAHVDFAVDCRTEDQGTTHCRVEIGPDVLPYSVFDLVSQPFVKSALTANVDDDLSRRVFVFLEQMAREQDIEIVNLLGVGIFEPWIADPGTPARAWKYMGREHEENSQRYSASAKAWR